MSDERVERVAAALAKASDAMQGNVLAAWADHTPEDQWAFREMARTAIAALDDDPSAERERALREDNERLRGKCNRLIPALYDLCGSVGKVEFDAVVAAYLHNGDLEPEPHGADGWHSGNAVSNAEIATVDVTAHARQESE